MSPPSGHTIGETYMEETVRMNWLKAMYVANVVVNVPIGLAILVAPELMREMMGIPAGDSIHYGMAAGAIPLAFGLAGALGLRSPLKLSPVLGLQGIYKSLFLIGVVLPLAVTGRVPGFAVPLIALFILFIIGDLIAVPFSYVLVPSSETQ